MYSDICQQDGASRGANSKRVAPSDLFDHETYSPQDYKIPVGSKVHCADDLSDSASSAEASHVYSLLLSQKILTFFWLSPIFQ